MNLHLTNKIVVISGGSKGIGAAIVRLFNEEGAIPVILDIDKKAAEELINQIGAGSFFELDLRDERRCEEVIVQILEKYNTIDVLINNAGINDCVGLEATNEEFISSLHKNLIHYFTLAKLCWPHLKVSKGTIVNIASKVAVIGQGNTSGYAAAKGGVLSLTKEWAVEGLPHGIRVNAVLPAEVYTEMYEYWLGKSFSDPKKMKKEIENKIPLGQRMTTAEEIAGTVVYLSSNMSSHTTGSFLYPDGGYVHLR